MCTLFWYQVAENLAQLMYSVMMNSYMFGNAQYQLELQQSLEHIALPDPEEKMYVLSDISIKMVGVVLMPLVTSDNIYLKLQFFYDYLFQELETFFKFEKTNNFICPYEI